MRERFDRVVLCGNSGGGSLYTFYVHQSLATPDERLHDTELRLLALSDAISQRYFLQYEKAAAPEQGSFLA